jgi:catalase
MKIQVMTEEQARKMPYNPFDLTKVWYKKDFPLIEVGVLELNKNPDNYFQDVEQAAFNPAVVPGISFSPDKMLQGRLFSYGDAQRYRLGVNHHQIPVNSPKYASANPSHRDGQMRVDGNHGATIGYEPNSFGEWQEQPEYKDPPWNCGTGQLEFSPRHSDYCTQPQALPPDESCPTAGTFREYRRAMGDAPEFIKIRHINNCCS